MHFQNYLIGAALKKKIKYLVDFFINNALIIFSIATVVSGFVIQFGFHFGHSNVRFNHDRYNSSIYSEIRNFDETTNVLGFDYNTWSITHKTVAIVLSLLMIYHFFIHFKWYKQVLIKHLLKKNKQVITLTLIFLIVALTGFVPWIIDSIATDSHSRVMFIEIHDKITFVLTIFLFIHIFNRLKWFPKVYTKLKE